MRFTALLLAALLSSCAAIPKDYEDNNVFVVNHKVYIRSPEKMSKEKYQWVVDHYTKPVVDAREKKALKGRRVADVADVVVTAVALKAGCSEMNPLVGSSPNIGVMLAAKGLSYWITYQAVKASPAAFSSAKEVKTGNYILFGAVAWNLYLVSQGCSV